MISFNCPFCAHSFQVEDDLGGKKINCPQCQESVPVPGGSVAPPAMPAPDPAAAAREMATRKANTQSTLSLVFGALSLMCACLMPVSIIFGILAMTKLGLDPARAGAIRVKSIIGMGMSVAFVVVWFGIVAISGAAAEENRAKTDEEMERAGELFNAGEYDEARSIYTVYSEDGYDSSIKARCDIRLGAIAFEKGEIEKAKSSFRKAVGHESAIQPDFDNPDAKKLFRMVRIDTIVKNGRIFFPVTVEGGLRGEVFFSRWRIEGKRIKCNVRLGGHAWNEIQISMVLHDENDGVLVDFNFEHDKDEEIGFLYLDYDGEWEQIFRLVAHVNAK